jgi:FkbM family methyltransferase
MKYGVETIVGFEEREIYKFQPKNFQKPVWCRKDTYDEYVSKEIVRSYGTLDVKDRVVLDIGANIGCFSRWALDQGCKSIVSIEPEPNNFNMLILNTQEDTGVTLINAALTPKPAGRIPLFISPTGRNPGNSSTYSRRGRISFEVDTISVLDLFSGDHDITVAKIDCEGAEYNLIPELHKTGLKEFALEYHINGFGVEYVEKAHHFLIESGWECTREPKMQENLWQTLASYRR